MERKTNPLPDELVKQLKDYVYPIVGAMLYVHNQLGPGLPEYVYQEALTKKLTADGFSVEKEFQMHPIFDGKPLDSYLKMDLMLTMSRGNVVVECKSIGSLTDKERYQTKGYLRGTRFPIGILVNFGTSPKAQIEKYYFYDGEIWAF